MTGAEPERLVDAFVGQHADELNWFLQDLVLSSRRVVFRARSWPESVYDQELDVLHAS
jgi:hypothetical protein